MALSLVLVVVVVVAAAATVVLIQRSRSKDGDEGDGADIVPYLILAVAIGVAGFALAELLATAFPGTSLVFDPTENVATSLSSLIVSTPFVVYLWRRQAQRRTSYPGSPGWTLYLSIIELVFMTALVVTSATFVNGLLTGEPSAAWTRAVVFAGLVVFHELAAQKTPPVSDAGELRRVLGSAIGLIPATIGLTGIILALLTQVDVITDPPDTPDLHPFVAMMIVGAPVWWYRWVRPWDAVPGAPRLSWAVVVSVGSLATALGALTAIAVLVFQFLFTSPGPGEVHFEPLKFLLALVLAGSPVWLVHRHTLNRTGGSALSIYGYAMAALGLASAASMAIALTVAALDRTLIVGGSPYDIVTYSVVLVAGIGVWLVFEGQATPGDEAPSWPRNLYTLGVGIVFGLVAAGSLITTLFIALRRLLSGTNTGSLLEAVTVFVYTGLVAWYLLSAYFRHRKTTPDESRIAPFAVTIVCSHPGMVATRFPEQARLRVLHRDDGVGVIDETMADEIVAAVANRPSVVWVDSDGFRVAQLRDSG